MYMRRWFLSWRRRGGKLEEREVGGEGSWRGVELEGRGVGGKGSWREGELEGRGVGGRGFEGKGVGGRDNHSNCYPLSDNCSQIF
jgi:hypothetical protein